VEEFDNLIETCEILRDAVRARSSEKGFEAVTVLLLQTLGVFGHSPETFDRLVPLLEALKDLVQSEAFEEAEPGVLALLALFREANKLVPDC
jgi:hypothetical protein